jgi:hypothetical protein
MKSIETATTDLERFVSTVEQLEALLRRQLTLAQKGNIAEMEILAEKAKDLVGQISKSKFLAKPQFKQRRERLKQIYSDLCLVLSSQMNDVSQALRGIRKGKKIMMLYRDNI